MPAAWWRDGVEILTLSLEREELTEDGQWSGLTTIPAMPGRAVRGQVGLDKRSAAPGHGSRIEPTGC
jgi:hypothetical protein